jgi:alkylation response protein AidB-like acyl-CoA dehydrogenase
MTDAELVQRLGEFLAANDDRYSGKDPAAKLAWRRDWTARLYDAGLAAPSWPIAAGGLGLTTAQQLTYSDLMRRAGAPSHPSANSWVVGPAIVEHGTPEQRERFLRPLMRADELWCQGFSEPEAGSDLPSLRTRALRDGDVYRVNGQKIWTTQATISEWMFALVRTGEPGSGRAGITYLLLPMDSPGITVRPLRDIGGGAHFAEVFFDDVEVPVANRLGAENDGWRVTRTTLGHERGTAFVISQMRYRRTVEDLMAVAARTGALEDPLLREEIAKVLVQVRALIANGSRMLNRVLAGEDPGPVSSANRLFAAEFEQRLSILGMRLAGDRAVLGTSDPAAFDSGRWTYGYLMTRAATIGAGTAEIQRNTIAERVLGLPRMDARRPE